MVTLLDFIYQGESINVKFREFYFTGVDLVLNSLAEDKLQASVRVLAAHGKFLEIGKYDLAKNTPLGKTFVGIYCPMAKAVS